MEIEQNYLVPDLIRKIFPRMKFKKYKELIENPGFLEFQIDLCEKCHLKIDKAVNIKEDISKLAKFEQKNDN